MDMKQQEISRLQIDALEKQKETARKDHAVVAQRLAASEETVKSLQAELKSARDRICEISSELFATQEDARISERQKKLALWARAAGDKDLKRVAEYNESLQKRLPRVERGELIEICKFPDLTVTAQEEALKQTFDENTALREEMADLRKNTATQIKAISDDAKLQVTRLKDEVERLTRRLTLEMKQTAERQRELTTIR
jgi:chromosome segregation ATPase